MASTSLLRRAVAVAPVPAARARRLRRGARRRGVGRLGRGVGRGGDAAAAADDADASSSSWDDGDTIAAIATPVVPQAGGVAIIRLSGPNAVAATRAVFRPAAKAERDAQRRGDPMVSHTALYGDVRDPRDGKVIDEVLVLPMLAPRSYTTEDVVEIHAHGGSVCVQRVLSLLLRNGDETFERTDDDDREADDDEKGDDAPAEALGEEPPESVPRTEKSFVRVRLARPGEFTLRAFLNGRLDLTQAEAVHGLVSAQTAAAADGALSALRGGLAGPVRRARREAVELLAELEARLDFDDALEPLDETRVSVRVSRLRDAVQSVLNTAERGRLRETGVSVAIVGRPNAGKSSLLNAWSRSDKAIVTDIAGTTRDVVEASVVVAGVPVTLLDTAGIRSDTRGDAVEAIGVERSLAAAKGADAVLLVVDARSGWADEDREVWERLVDVNASKNESEETATFEDEDAFGKNEFENARARLYATRGGLERFAGTERDASREWNDSNDAFHLESSFSETVNESDSERRVPLLLALNKTDAVPEKERKNVKADVPRDVLDASDAVVETSAVTRAGLDALETALATIVGAGEIEAEGAQWAANQRQAEALRVAAAALARLAETVQDGLPVDFWTIDLREAAAALGEITGEDIAEDVLDVVFTKFCIGK